MSSDVSRLDVIPRRRWVLVAERLSEAVDDRTARYFYDKQTGLWHAAESWKRPKPWPMSPSQCEYLDSLGLIH